MQARRRRGADGPSDPAGLPPDTAAHRGGAARRRDGVRGHRHRRGAAVGGRAGVELDRLPRQGHCRICRSTTARAWCPTAGVAWSNRTRARQCPAPTWRAGSSAGRRGSSAPTSRVRCKPFSELVDDFNAGRLRDPIGKPSALDKLVRERQPDIVDAAGWRAIDAAEVARGDLSDRPRNKFTSIADMLDVAAAAPGPPLRRRLADRLRELADLA